MTWSARGQMAAHDLPTFQERWSTFVPPHLHDVAALYSRAADLRLRREPVRCDVTRG